MPGASEAPNPRPFTGWAWPDGAPLRLAVITGMVAEAACLPPGLPVAVSGGDPARAEALARAAVELAKDWRTDKYLQKLEAMLIVMDAETTLLLSGTGDVVEPDEGVIAIGSGGSYALAAARALMRKTSLGAKEIAEESLRIAAEICVYTNDSLVVEEIA